MFHFEPICRVLYFDCCVFFFLPEKYFAFFQKGLTQAWGFSVPHLLKWKQMQKYVVSLHWLYLPYLSPGSLEPVQPAGFWCIEKPTWFLFCFLLLKSLAITINFRFTCRFFFFSRAPGYPKFSFIWPAWLLIPWLSFGILKGADPG